MNPFAGSAATNGTVGYQGAFIRYATALPAGFSIGATLANSAGGGANTWSTATQVTLGSRYLSGGVPTYYAGFAAGAGGAAHNAVTPGTSAFVGFRFNSGGNTLYGWVRLSVGPGSIDFVSAAYNTIPGAPITAGAIPEPSSLAHAGFGRDRNRWYGPQQAPSLVIAGVFHKLLLIFKPPLLRKSGVCCFMRKELARRVLLVGWDAADWSFLTPLLDAGKMPNLQSLIEGGVSGRIATLQPILSPILWTSIATGKRGDKHGVLSFVEPLPDGTGIRVVGSRSRRTKAIWNILSQLGRRSAVVNWFASHPAEPIHGAIVSNHFSEAALRAAPADEVTFHPRDLAPVMEKLRVTPATITPEQLAPFFLDKLPKDDDSRLQSLAKLVAQCASVHNAATYLAEVEEWDFLAVYYDMIDHAGHGFAQYTEPRMEHISEEDFEIFRHVMESTYRYHDLMLGRWLELAGADTTVIVLSDHGFYHGAGRPLADRGHISGERPPGSIQTR